MTLDVTVIVAQIVNFAVLVWLLNRFLYRPITNMIKSREDKLRQRAEQAQATEAKAKQALAAYQKLQAELERERGRLLEQARQEARQERARLLEAAAAEAQQARRQFTRSLNAERAELASSIQENLIRQVCETSGLIMSHLGGMSLSDAIIGTLEERYEEQKPTPFSDRPDVVDTRILVRTSFPPTPEQKARLTALAAKMRPATPGSTPGRERGGQPPVQFQVDPALVLGVEIESGGTAIAWSARDMLEELEQDALVSLASSADTSGPSPHLDEVNTNA